MDRDKVRHKFRVNVRYIVRVINRFRDNIRVMATEKIRVRIQTVPGL